MKTWVQRIRGAIGIGLTWAGGWVPLGAITGWITGTALGFPASIVATNYAVTFGVLGFIGGTIFSTVLSLTERRSSFERLSLPRFVAWGALGGLVLGGLSVAAGLLGSGATILGAVIAGASTLLGAVSAAGTLAVARIGRRDALASGDGDDDVRLTASNERQRLKPAK